MRLKGEAAEELRTRTMKLIDTRRQHHNDKKADLYAADSAEAARAEAAQNKNVHEGRKQKKSADLLAKNIDIPLHITNKRDAMRIKVRCKNGNKVDSVYRKSDKQHTRSPDCPPDVGNEIEMKPEQGENRFFTVL